MRTITTFDKIMMCLGFLIVIAIFSLAFVLSGENKTCALNPCNYADQKNISCSNNQEWIFNFSEEEKEKIISNEEQR